MLMLLLLKLKPQDPGLDSDRGPLLLLLLLLLPVYYHCFRCFLKAHSFSTNIHVINMIKPSKQDSDRSGVGGDGRARDVEDPATGKQGWSKHGSI